MKQVPAGRGPRTTSLVTEGNDCRLQVGVMLDRFRPKFVADSGLLDATERNREIEYGVRVHPNRSGPEIPDEPVCPFEAPRPDAGAEAVLGIVGHFQGLLDRAETRGGENGTEYLVLHYAHAGSHIGQYGGLDVCAWPGQGCATDDHCGTLGTSGVDIVQHASLLLV